MWKNTGSLHWKAPVDTSSSLPLSGNSEGDARIVKDTTKLYVWSISASTGDLTDWVEIGGGSEITSTDDVPEGTTNKYFSGKTQDDLPDGITAKQYTVTEESKLAGIEAGADVTDATNVGTSIHGVSAKGSFVDDDAIPVIDSQASNVLKKNLWSVVKSTLKTYFDVIYTTLTAVKADVDVADAISKKHTQGHTLTNSADHTDVDAASVAIDDTLVWNGSAWINKPLKETIGQVVSYFLDDTASDIGGYFTLSKAPTGGIEVQDSVVVNNSRELIEAYASGILGGETIEAGAWEFSVWVGTSSTFDNSFLDIDVYSRASGGVETLLFSVSTPELDTAAITQYNILSVQSSFAINPTDRLVIKIYGRTDATVNRTITYTHNGTSRYSHFHTPLIIRHNDLAGLNAGDYIHLTASEKSDVDSAVSLKHSHTGNNVGTYRLEFDNSDLSSGILSITHNLGQMFVSVVVIDDTDVTANVPVAYTDDNNLLLDFTGFGVLTGTWNLVVQG